MAASHIPKACFIVRSICKIYPFFSFSFFDLCLYLRFLQPCCGWILCHPVGQVGHSPARSLENVPGKMNQLLNSHKMVWKRDFVLFPFPPFTFSSFVHTPHVQLYLSPRTLGSQSFIILKVLSVFSPWSVHHLPGLGIDKSSLVETGKRLEIHHRLLDLSSKSCFCLQGCGALFTLHVPIPGQNGDNDGDEKKRFLTSSSR